MKLTAAERNELSAVFAAFVRDRREQYKPSSGTYHAFVLLEEAISDGEVFARFQRGELDDLLKLTYAGRRAVQGASE